MNSVFRIAGWVVFAAGVGLILLGKVNDDFALTKWGALTGCGGMIMTYASNLVRQARRARRLPGSMRRSDDPATGEQEPPGDAPPGAP